MNEVKILSNENEWLEIALSGDIDLGNAEAFYNSVCEAYETAPKSILFDCENLEFIDSTTLGTFVKLLKKVKTDVNSMKLVRLQAKIKKLFLICALDSIMEIA